MWSKNSKSNLIALSKFLNGQRRISRNVGRKESWQGNRHRRFYDFIWTCRNRWVAYVMWRYSLVFDEQDCRHISYNWPPTNELGSKINVEDRARSRSPATSWILDYDVIAVKPSNVAFFLRFIHLTTLRPFVMLSHFCINHLTLLGAWQFLARLLVRGENFSNGKYTRDSNPQGHRNFTQRNSAPDFRISSSHPWQPSCDGADQNA